MSVAVIYLVWAPYGVRPVENFVQSYIQHPAGLPHDLVVVYSGFGNSDVRISSFEHVLETIPHKVLYMAQSQIDLESYFAAAKCLDYEYFCFLNSRSRILAGNWLAFMYSHARMPGVGIVGATGSYESTFSVKPRPGRWLHFPRFPNPHIRTTAFMMSAANIHRLRLPHSLSRPGALRLESGRSGITRQLLDSGLTALIIGKDGHGYDVRDWPSSKTFRQGEQENLLVADGRTDEYLAGGERERKTWNRWSWGRRWKAQRRT